MSREVMLLVKLDNDEEAATLARFLKRVGYHDCRANAEGDEDAYAMLRALRQVQFALDKKGFSPR